MFCDIVVIVIRSNVLICCEDVLMHPTCLRSNILRCVDIEMIPILQQMEFGTTNYLGEYVYSFMESSGQDGACIPEALVNMIIKPMTIEGIRFWIAIHSTCREFSLTSDTTRYTIAANHKLLVDFVLEGSIGYCGPGPEKGLLLFANIVAREVQPAGNVITLWNVETNRDQVCRLMSSEALERFIVDMFGSVTPYVDDLDEYDA